MCLVVLGERPSFSWMMKAVLKQPYYPAFIQAPSVSVYGLSETERLSSK
jgi:hypothetical protein